MEILIEILILVISVIIHEVSHGYAAFALGDPTAKYAGRLTLNPVKHLDLWGSFLLPLLMVVTKMGMVFGWAKPVPYNPYNLRNQRFGPALVGAAGPLANLVLALIAGLAMGVIFRTGGSGLSLYNFLEIVARINILLLVFNLLPVPPLDGSKLLFSVLPISEQTKMTLEQNGFFILIAFLFFFSAPISSLIIRAQELFFNFFVFSGLG